MRFKTRLTLTFGAFSFALSLLFAALLNESLNALENHIASSLLKQEANYLLSRYQKNPEQLALPDMKQLKGYLSNTPNSPTWLKSLAVGLHQTKQIHVLVQNLDAELRLYLVYDETHGVLELFETRLLFILGLVVLVVSGVGVGLGFYQARVLARPVHQLVAQVGMVNVESPEITPLPNNDEIGLLSRAYANLVDRLHQFIQREKAFTRYASHELKTPITIINNNLELLLNEKANAQTRSRAITRLQQATQHMQQQIEVFLILAREDQIQSAQHPLDWNRVWNDTQAHFPEVSLTLQVEAEPEVFVSEAVAQTILFNMLSNVVKHGEKMRGAINTRAILTAGSLTMINTASATQSVATHGFGLEINKKLCDAIGWCLSTQQANNQFTVTINFGGDRRN